VALQMSLLRPAGPKGQVTGSLPAAVGRPRKRPAPSGRGEVVTTSQLALLLMATLGVTAATVIFLALQLY
jgi:hypothetical protein